MATHPIIETFQVRAELLDMQGSSAGLDEAIAQLAAWMSLASDRLKEDDFVVLTEVGAVLYRDGLRRKQSD